jgi:hypothetical protein
MWHALTPRSFLPVSVPELSITYHEVGNWIFTTSYQEGWLLFYPSAHLLRRVADA